MTQRSTQVIFDSRPVGWVQESNFRIAHSELSAPGPDEVLVANHYLSLDPYMRGRMSTGKSYVKGVEPGDVMVGETAGVVLTSNHPRFQPGEFVTGRLGWQTHALAKGESLRKVDPRLVPLSYYLGVVGMPGCTAYFGVTEIGQPKVGDTVVVSGAAGAVGGIVGQLAKMQGCRVVGIAGGRAKCDYVTGELGFDACVDYKAGKLADDLKAAAPKGIDVYWENVGGETLDQVLKQMNTFGRIVVCGLISQYNATEAYGYKELRAILVNRLKVQGMIVFDWEARYPEAWRKLADWVASGKLKYRETIAQGIENAPRAFIGMLRGENVGKQIVKLI